MGGGILSPCCRNYGTPSKLRGFGILTKEVHLISDNTPIRNVHIAQMKSHHLTSTCFPTVKSFLKGKMMMNLSLIIYLAPDATYRLPQMRFSQLNKVTRKVCHHLLSILLFEKWEIFGKMFNECPSTHGTSCISCDCCCYYCKFSLSLSLLRTFTDIVRDQ